MATARLELVDAPSTHGERHPEFVQSLERGLSVIRVFSESPRLTLAEVAKATGLTRATARRFLITLQELGYVGEDGRYFYLRPRILDIGYSYLSSFDLADVAQAHLEELSEDVHESASASVLDGGEIVYVAQAAAARIMTVQLGIGRKLPAYATSMGRMLLAHVSPEELDEYFAHADLEPLTHRTVTGETELRRILTDVAAQGFAIVDEEFEDGVKSISVPLHDRGGQVIAAINLCAPVSRARGDTLEHDYLPKLISTARQIEARIL
jgi:IclR family transcriptional regulator, pca regulon regulatory protein